MSGSHPDVRKSSRCQPVIQLSGSHPDVRKTSRCQEVIQMSGSPPVFPPCWQVSWGHQGRGFHGGWGCLSCYTPARLHSCSKSHWLGRSWRWWLQGRRLQETITNLTQPFLRALCSLTSRTILLNSWNWQYIICKMYQKTQKKVLYQI